MSTTDDGPATTPASRSAGDDRGVTAGGFEVRDPLGFPLPVRPVMMLPTGEEIELPRPRRTSYQQTTSHECEICGEEIELTISGEAHEIDPADDASREFHALSVGVKHRRNGHALNSSFVL